MMANNKVPIGEIISADEPGLLIKWAKYYASKTYKKKEGKSEATKTQIRRLFSSLKNIEYSWPKDTADQNYKDDLNNAYRQLLLLSPRLAYESGRHSALKDLCDVIIEGINYINKNDRKAFERLVQFYEAIIGYYTGLEGGRG